MGFDLSKQVKALDYHLGGGLRGTVPEPSPKAVNRYNSRIADNLSVIGKERPNPSDTEAIAKLLSELTEDDMNAIGEENLDAVAELCDGSPSRADLEALGHRGFQAFMGWLSGELNNPEGARPATSR
ncbi:hypothetical protein [Saccharopolyspora pogona]|uniref:hypothetical protein n=1 Tax=Saccharopolyspora pogona TaxID=333966 RepID=UPI001689399D|nr:hypothetical protein [Saccharopolyspora pogona]